MKLYTAKAISRRLGIPEDEVAALTKAGVIRDGLKKPNLYAMEETARELLSEYRKSEEKRENVDYKNERAKLMRIRRLNEEYDLQLREGELHRTDDIELTISKMITAFKSRVTAIPAKAAPMVAGMSDTADIFDALQQLANEALIDLSDLENLFAQEDK